MTPLTTKAAEIRAGLVERLRDDRHCNDWYLRQEAAALIEQQAAELAEARRLLELTRKSRNRWVRFCLAEQAKAETAESERDEARATLQVAKDGWRDAEDAANTLKAERDELLREKERMAKERDEARAYLKAFCRACVDSEFDRNPVGVHEANPSLGWVFSLDDMYVCPQQHITGGQVRRAMEIVGFDKLKIEPATRTISDELSENRAAARTAEATIASQSERIAVLEAALRPFADVADVDEETGRDDPDDDRILVVQAHGCQLAELSTEDFRRARAALAPLGEE